MQVEAYGGLSGGNKASATGNRPTPFEMVNPNAALGSNRIKPGTQMIRQWQNTHS